MNNYLYLSLAQRLIVYCIVLIGAFISLFPNELKATCGELFAENSRRKQAEVSLRPQQGTLAAAAAAEGGADVPGPLDRPLPRRALRPRNQRH